MLYGIEILLFKTDVPGIYHYIQRLLFNLDVPGIQHYIEGLLFKTEVPCIQFCIQILLFKTDIHGIQHYIERLLLKTDVDIVRRSSLHIFFSIASVSFGESEIFLLLHYRNCLNATFSFPNPPCDISIHGTFSSKHSNLK